MNSKNLLLTASWLLSIVITWKLATELSQTKSTENPKTLSSLNKSTINESNSDSSSKSSSHQTRRISIARKPTDTRSPDILLAEIKDLVDMENRWLSEYEQIKIFKFLQQCSVEEIRDLLSNCHEKPDTGPWGRLRAMAVITITEFSPDDAVEALHELRANAKGGEGESTIAFIDADIIDVVSSNDPLKALNILKNDTQRIFSLDNYKKVFSELSRNDYNTAISELNNLENHYRTEAVCGIAASLKTPEEFLSFSEQVDISKEQPYAINRIVNNWALLSPLDALNWAKNIGEDKNKITSQIYQVWLSGEPQKAADWILNKEADKTKGYSEIMQAGQNNFELLKWLKQQPDSDEKEAAYMTRILNSKDAPQLKIEFLKEVRSQRKRKNAAELIYKNMVDKITSEPHNRRYYSKLSAEFLRDNTDLTDEEKGRLKLQNN